MKLIKVRTSDVQSIVRSLCADDYGFITSKAGTDDPSLKLDAWVKEILLLSVSSYFFKVQDETGSLIGFFISPFDNPDKLTKFFYIKKSARTDEYYSAFYTLVSETVYGQINQSLSTVNVEDMNSLLQENFTILGPYKPHGFNIKAT